MATRKNGHFIARVEIDGESAYLVDGNIITFGKSFASSNIFVDDKFAFSLVKDGRNTIVFNGKVIDGIAEGESGPFNINGKLGYIKKNSDNTTQLVVGDGAVGPKFKEKINNVAVSEKGKVAIQTIDENKESVIYLEGKEIYKGYVGNLSFFDEKLLIRDSRE